MGGFGGRDLDNVEKAGDWTGGEVGFDDVDVLKMLASS